MTLQENYSDQVNHPNHYNQLPAKCKACGEPIECKDVNIHMNFPIGAAMKYLWRYRYKGAPIQDLQKAIRYIEFEIERILGETK